jgi:hypothetical protein
MTIRSPWEPEDSAAAERIARLVEYFRENRERFTPEALRQAAAAAGYSATDVDAAWSQLAWGSAELPGPATRRTPGMGTILLVLAVIAAFGSTIWLAVAYISSVGQWLGPDRDQVVVLGTFAAAMLVGGLFSVYRLLRAPSSGGGTHAIGMAFLLAIAIYIGLSGLCIAGLVVSNQPT